jgi:hypothetical protein
VISEGPERPTIRGHRVVREEARHHSLQPSPLFGNGVVHAVTQLLLHLSKLRPHAIPPCLAKEQERPAPGLTAYEREPQEGKGLWLAKPFSLSPYRRLTAELQQSALLPVKLEPELLEPRSHRIPEAPRVGFVLETSNDIVGVSPATAGVHGAYATLNLESTFGILQGFPSTTEWARLSEVSFDAVSTADPTALIERSGQAVNCPNVPLCTNPSGDNFAEALKYLIAFRESQMRDSGPFKPEHERALQPAISRYSAELSADVVARSVADGKALVDAAKVP